MKIRCMGCMEQFDSEFSVCPHCGYVVGTKAEEAIHIAPGTLLYNRYFVGKVLGYGGFGVTYIGWDGKLEQKVAIKEYLPGEFSTRMPGHPQVTVFAGEKNQQFSAGKEKFIDEARRLAKFQNEEGIVKIFDSFEENDTAYIVMEYLEGETLADYLKREGTIPEDEAVAMLLPLMKSLESIHAENMIHRDIAPDNIFLTNTGEVKLIDFGASRYATTSHSRSLTVIIKQGYSPEEQYRSRGDQGPYTDVYALSATLYKMITGKTPPDAMERRAKYENQSKDILEPPHKLVKISKTRENAILNAMNVRIEDRTSSVSAFVSDLTAETPVKRIYGKIKKLDFYSWPLWLKIAIPTVLAGIAVFLGLLFTGVINFSLFTEEIVIPDGIVIVPDVEGYMAKEAIDTIESVGLLAQTSGTIESEYIPAGKIILQNPVGDSYMFTNSTVLLTVSSGKQIEEAVDGIATVPYVVWDTKETAIEKLTKAGLGTPVIVEENDENVSYGHVIAQSIEVGENVTVGTQLVLTVSLGAKSFDIPDVSGKRVDEAKKELENLGLKVEISYSDANGVPENQVIGQETGDSGEVKRGDTVTIIVSSGKNLVPVENFVGEKGSEAKKKLTKKNLKVTVLEEYSNDVEKGNVIRQNPSEGVSLPEGTEITLFVSKGRQIVTVSFNPNGGTLDGNVTKQIPYMDAYGNLPSASRTGYKFEGWYSAEKNGKAVNSSTEVNTPSAHMLYAYWSPIEYTVSFDANGGNVEKSSIKVTYDSAYGSLPFPVRTGYSFDGWFTDKAAGNSVEEKDIFSLNSNQTLYAHWTASTGIVKFDANGGIVTVNEKGITQNNAYGTLPVPSYVGYEFTGWYTKKNAGEQVTASTIVTEVSDHTLYAHWQSVGYTLTLNPNGGTIGTTQKTIYYGGTIGSLPTPSRSGFNFSGWYTAEGAEITESTLYSFTSDKTIYARWNEETYIVSINANGGVADSTSIVVNYGSAYGTLPNATQTGYRFIGWSTENDGSGMVTATSIVNKTGNHTLYAQWAEIDITVSLNANGGTTSTASIDTAYGKTYGNLPTPVRKGYKFEGWFNASEGGEKISSDSKVISVENHTLYAHWSVIKYVVSFDANGGTVPTGSIETTYGAEYGTLPTPTLNGYIFKGWYTATSGGDQITASNKFMTEENQTLYAQWTVSECTVSLNPNGGTLSQSSVKAPFGGNIGTLPMPSWEGHSFDGWFTSADGGTQVTESTIVDNEKGFTIYAHWSLANCTVNLNGNGGTVSPESVSVKYGQGYGILPTPARNGYSFSGWFTSATGGSEITSDTKVTNANEHTVYAHWTVVSCKVTLNPNGGLLSNNTIDAAFGSIYGTLPTPVRQGYSFKGWFDAATGGSEVTSASNVTATTDHTLYAQWTAMKYAVSFDANGGKTSPDGISVTFGGSYGTLPSVERNGYSFNGWFTSKNGGSQITGTSEVTTVGDHTLYAQWTAAHYSVSLETNGGILSSNSIEVDYDSTYGSLPEPTREGYNFNGWYTAKSGGSKVTSATKVTSTATHTIYAQWAAINYSVSFKAQNGGNDPNSITVNYGAAYGSLPTVTKTGCSFDGWFTSASGGSQVTSETVFKGSADVTLYAHWSTLKYDVLLNANGGLVTPSTVTVTYGEGYGSLPKPTAPAGYTFNGWYTAATGGTQIASTTKVTSEKAHTLYAQWSTLSYTITLNANGGKVDPGSIEKPYGSTYGDLPTPTYAGYSFLGWYTAATGGTKISSSDSFMLAENQTLYAQWKVRNYTVSFNANGGSVKPSETSVVYDGTYGTLPEPTRTGYTFSGWYTELDGGNAVSGSSRFTGTSNQTLYAHWTAKNVTVTLNANGGTLASGSGSLTVKYDGTYSGLAGVKNPSNTGKTFVGWYTATSGGSQVTSSTMVKTESNHTLYAIWEDVKYTVSFDAGKGKATASSIETTYGAVYGTLPDATRTGYSFDGWYTAANGGDKVSGTDKFTKTAGQTLYAHWTAKSMKVTLDANGGTISSGSITVTYDGTYSGLTDPSYTGKKFLGWYTTTSGGNQVTSSTTVTATGDHTLYARWDDIGYTITFNGNGGTPSSNSLTAKYGVAYGTLPTASRTGYTFNGWYTAATGGTAVSGTDKFTGTSAQTLYAQWTAKSVTVTLNANGGTLASGSLTVTYDGIYSGLKDPTAPTGKTFAGWYTATSGGTQVTSSTKVTTDSNHTLYALWNDISYTVTFNGNGGTPSSNSLTAKYGVAYGMLPTASRTGYTFNGWYIAASGGTKVSATDKFMETGAQTLYAQWTAKSVTVTLNANGGTLASGSGSLTVTYDGIYSGLKDPTAPKGRTFAGWYTATSGGTQVTSSTKVTTDVDHTLYARWKNNDYTITFDGNGGTPSYTSMIANYDVAFEKFPTATRSEYDFLGWYTAPTGGVRVSETDRFNGTSDQILYAQWERVYTVRFHTGENSNYTGYIHWGERFGDAFKDIIEATGIHYWVSYERAEGFGEDYVWQKGENMNLYQNKNAKIKVYEYDYDDPSKRWWHADEFEILPGSYVSFPMGKIAGYSYPIGGEDYRLFWDLSITEYGIPRFKE